MSKGSTWQLARLLAEGLDVGMDAEQMAREIGGCTPEYVARSAATWREFCDRQHERLTFSGFYAPAVPGS